MRSREIVIEVVGRSADKVRFRLTQAVAVGHHRWSAGDVVSNYPPPTPTSPWYLAEAQDKYWEGLDASVMAPGMVPLDVASQRMKDQSAFAGEVIRTWVTGADSIK